MKKENKNDGVKFSFKLIRAFYNIIPFQFSGIRINQTCLIRNSE